MIVYMPLKKSNIWPMRKIAALLAALLSSCVAVKPYQRVYLNDKHMQLGKPDIAAFDESAQTYREGASGGGNGKASGGCGCN
jgi:hypothetical protein